MDKLEKLLTAEEVGALLRVDARTINERYAYNRDFPDYVKPLGAKLWKQSEILKYIDSTKRKAA